MTTKAAVRRRRRVVFDKPRQRRLPQHAGKRAPTALSVRIVIFMVQTCRHLLVTGGSANSRQTNCAQVEYAPKRPAGLGRRWKPIAIVGDLAHGVCSALRPVRKTKGNL